jgi:hypothetical protein
MTTHAVASVLADEGLAEQVRRVGDVAHREGGRPVRTQALDGTRAVAGQADGHAGLVGGADGGAVRRLVGVPFASRLGPLVGLEAQRVLAGVRLDEAVAATRLTEGLSGAGPLSPSFVFRFFFSVLSSAGGVWTAWVALAPPRRSPDGLIAAAATARPAT